MLAFQNTSRRCTSSSKINNNTKTTFTENNALNAGWFPSNRSMSDNFKFAVDNAFNALGPMHFIWDESRVTRSSTANLKLSD